MSCTIIGAAVTRVGRLHLSIWGYAMPKSSPDTAVDIAALEQRVKVIGDWLDKNGAACFMEQRHLREGTTERIYWHYGYMVAVRDVLRFLTGEKLATDRNPEDTSTKCSAA